MKNLSELLAKKSNKPAAKTKSKTVKKPLSKKLTPTPSRPKNLNESVQKKKEYLTRDNNIEVLCDRNYFKLFEFLAYGFVGLICVLGIVITLISTSRPNVKFFNTNSKGQIAEVNTAGNDSSSISNGSVQQFFLEAIPNSFTFDFNDYEYVFRTNLPKYFTSEATSEVIKYFDQNYIQDVIEQKQFFNVSVIGSFIIDQGFKYGKRTNEWRVQVPAIINIYDGRSQKQTNVKFQFVVKYTGTNLNAYGLEISQIKLTNNWRY
jgi:hypothetical protein